MAAPNNLPAEVSSFVGREHQLAELRRLLHRSRLVTLTGPGGAGKTRLALRLAGDLIDRYRDGVFLVELATLTDPRLLELTVATACGVREQRKRPITEVLLKTLATSRMLLVLDGCEHLVESCAALVGRIQRSCPKVTVLVTSREPLGLPGEVIWRTPSLTIPRPQDTGHPELLMESEAIRLFVERARLSRPDFELLPGGTAALAQICTRLEGMPLAIELAAGLAGVMTLQEILERLRDRFRLLTGGSRSALPRHQTLRQAVDWSYGLLSQTEQALFARLSVFARGFDLLAAEAVASGDPIAVEEVVPLLSRLVNKSLVVAESGRPNVTRYRMLDTIREYALDKLQESGESHWRRKHADYFREWCARVTSQLTSRDQMSWLRRLDEEQANIRLALEWSLSEQPDDALRLAASAGSYWWMRRHVAEGLEWLGRALEVEASSPEVRAIALLARARLSRRHGDWPAARRDADECASMCRQLGLQVELSRALTMLGIISSHAGDITTSRGFFMEAMELGVQLGDRDRIASNLNNLSQIAVAFGDLETARTRVEEALGIAESLGDRWLKANILDTVGRIHYRLGNHDISRRSYAEALAISTEFEDPLNIADCLDGLALHLIDGGDPTRAVALISAAQALRAATGAERTADWTSEVVEGLARARAKMGRLAADAAWAKGAALSMKDAVRLATGEKATALHDGAGPLTTREKQVALLIADGLTNAEIASRLRMAERTADAHVEHIRNKLGLRSRAQIAVWTHERLRIGAK